MRKSWSFRGSLNRRELVFGRLNRTNKHSKENCDLFAYDDPFDPSPPFLDASLLLGRVTALSTIHIELQIDFTKKSNCRRRIYFNSKPNKENAATAIHCKGAFVRQAISAVSNGGGFRSLRMRKAPRRRNECHLVHRTKPARPKKPLGVGYLEQRRAIRQRMMPSLKERTRRVHVHLPQRKIPRHAFRDPQAPVEWGVIANLCP